MLFFVWEGTDWVNIFVALGGLAHVRVLEAAVGQLAESVRRESGGRFIYVLVEVDLELREGFGIGAVSLHLVEEIYGVRAEFAGQLRGDLEAERYLLAALCVVNIEVVFVLGLRLAHNELQHIIRAPLEFQTDLLGGCAAHGVHGHHREQCGQPLLVGVHHHVALEVGGHPQLAALLLRLKPHLFSHLF